MPKLIVERPVRKTVSKGTLAKTSKKLRREIQGSFKLRAKHGPNFSRFKKLGRNDAVCPSCGAVYFEKHWHSPAALFRKEFDLSSARKMKCGECQAQGAAPAAEGRLILDNLVDAAEKMDVLRVVRNVGARAMKRDPEDRILKIADRGRRVEVLVSENQLAVSIGKQVHRARKGGTLAIVWSKNDLPVTVRWTRKS